MTRDKTLPIDIFVVDDERVIGHTLGIILRQAGYGVSVFEDALQAREHLHTAPRLLISDQQMPGLSGCELAFAAFEKAPETKVLLFSSSLAHTDVEWRAVAKRSNAAKLLAKPLYPTALLSCVEEMIGLPIVA
jgi:DNA-binding NtrC family response regulator